MSEQPQDGRRSQAARNDLTILDAARTVFLADAKAPIAAVAKEAGVGISALYRRWSSKEDLLRRLCADGLDVYIAEAEAVADLQDGWAALTQFLRRVVAADVHSLTVHLGGTFTPTPEMFEASTRAGALTETLVRRAHRSGKLRKDVGVPDITLVLEGCAAIRVPDLARTAVIRQRFLSMLLGGMASPAGSPLPGPAPRLEEVNWRWMQIPVSSR